MVKGKQTVYKQSKLDEIKEKAPEMYKVMKEVKKRFGGFVIKKLKFKEK